MIARIYAWAPILWVLDRIRPESAPEAPKVPDADHRRWKTEDGHPEDGEEVIVLTGCNAGKRGRVVKHDFRQVFVQCEPGGVGWYSGNQLDRAVKAGEP